MFQILLVSFREGLEAFLIVAIAAIYLRRTGRQVLLSALRMGTGAAVVLSVVLGLVLARVGALSSAWSGVMALVAAAAVITCTVHMMLMIVFSVQLVIYAFHEFTEAGLVPGIDNARWHLATEDLAEGAIAQAISIGLVLLPVVWLAAAHWFARPAPARQPG